MPYVMPLESLNPHNRLNACSFSSISSRTSYDRFGQEYDVSQIINDDATLNIDKYHQYSPLFLSTTFALTYGLSFASISATLMHTFLFFRKQIWVQSRRAMNEQPDIHARLMSRYAQVPDWWYASIFSKYHLFSLGYEGGIVYVACFSYYVRIWYYFYRGLEYAIPGLGICPCIGRFTYS